MDEQEQAGQNVLMIRTYCKIALFALPSILVTNRACSQVMYATRYKEDATLKSHVWLLF
jgi:hypothetical protein